MKLAVKTGAASSLPDGGLALTNSSAAALGVLQQQRDILIQRNLLEGVIGDLHINALTQDLNGNRMVVGDAPDDGDGTEGSSSQQVANLDPLLANAAAVVAAAAAGHAQVSTDQQRQLGEGDANDGDGVDGQKSAAGAVIPSPRVLVKRGNARHKKNVSSLTLSTTVAGQSKAKSLSESINLKQVDTYVKVCSNTQSPSHSHISLHRCIHSSFDFIQQVKETMLIKHAVDQVLGMSSSQQGDFAKVVQAADATLLAAVTQELQQKTNNLPEPLLKVVSEFLSCSEDISLFLVLS